MTIHALPATSTVVRTAGPRRYLMCAPDKFAVTYAINPWMDPTAPVDPQRALCQWQALRRTYEELGHRVELIDPAPGLPDMVFAANGGVVIDGRALAARFTHAEREAEGDLYRRWFEAAGMAPAVQAMEQNEGEGDFLTIGAVILAGTGFRTSLAAHREVAEFFGRPVVSLTLVDPRFYHLDTALTILDEKTIAYFPDAFSTESQVELGRLYPSAVLASEADAEVFGLNAISDGRHVVLSDRAIGLHAQLSERGFEPIGVDMTELVKAGGAAKCCTLELRS